MRLVLTGALSAVCAALSACAGLDVGGRQLHRSPEVRSAEGTVKFQKIGSDETGIELRVKNLKEPEEMVPPGYSYVAWVRSTPEDPAHNVGPLNLDDDLSGELRTETPLRRFELFVTAEPTSDAAEPTGQRLLWASRE